MYDLIRTHDLLPTRNKHNEPGAMLPGHQEGITQVSVHFAFFHRYVHRTRQSDFRGNNQNFLAPDSAISINLPENSTVFILT
jgi:hypothetical protein